MDDAGRHRRPPQSDVDRDRRLPDAGHEGHEVGEHPPLDVQLEAQRLPDREVIRDVLSERGHAAALGHGWMSAANARRSTLA